MSEPRIVTVDDVERVHATLARMVHEQIHETPLGPLSPSARAGWAAIIASIHPVFGQDAYASVALKAARLLCGGATTQHLLDGNKRLATAVMHEQLAINGYTLDTSSEELIAIVLTISNSQPAEFERIVQLTAAWIDQHMQPL